MKNPCFNAGSSAGEVLNKTKTAEGGFWMVENLLSGEHE
jgi:hypothetical protein